MPQLSLYIDSETIKKLEIAAKIEKTSISKWVNYRLHKYFETEWPPNYFDLFGSIDDKTLKRPSQLKYAKDSKRTNL